MLDLAPATARPPSARGKYVKYYYTTRRAPSLFLARDNESEPGRDAALFRRGLDAASGFRGPRRRLASKRASWLRPARPAEATIPASRNAGKARTDRRHLLDRLSRGLYADWGMTVRIAAQRAPVVGRYLAGRGSRHWRRASPGPSCRPLPRSAPQAPRRSRREPSLRRRFASRGAGAPHRGEERAERERSTGATRRRRTQRRATTDLRPRRGQRVAATSSTAWARGPPRLQLVCRPERRWWTPPLELIPTRAGPGQAQPGYVDAERLPSGCALRIPAGTPDNGLLVYVDGEAPSGCGPLYIRQLLYISGDTDSRRT